MSTPGQTAAPAGAGWGRELGDPMRAGGEVEQSVMLLSAGESENGAFLFPADPALGVVMISVASYSEP